MENVLASVIGIDSTTILSVAYDTQAPITTIIFLEDVYEPV
jgi:hypothetical protein